MRMPPLAQDIRWREDDLSRGRDMAATLIRADDDAYQLAAHGRLTPYAPMRLSADSLSRYFAL